MPNPRMKQRRVVHKSTAGIQPSQRLWTLWATCPATTNTVAPPSNESLRTGGPVRVLFTVGRAKFRFVRSPPCESDAIADMAEQHRAQRSVTKATANSKQNR